MAFRMVDNSAAVRARMNSNIGRALEAMGITAQKAVLEKMQSGYHDAHVTYNTSHQPIGVHTAIRDTGDLMNDLSYEADAAARKVSIGNTKEYATYVHEGTSRLHGRPYLRDGVNDGKSAIQQAAQTELKKGF